MVSALLFSLREHWPKVLAAILVPVILGAIGLYVAKQEREETRRERALVEQGETKAIVRQQERVLHEVETYQNATQHRDVGELERVRVENDRCARAGADCF